jgi:hypothetical protein
MTKSAVPAARMSVAASGPASGKEQPVRSAEAGIGDEGEESQHRNRRRRDEHARLPVTVDEARHARRDERIGDGEGGGDGAGHPVAAGGLAEHGDDADGDHGEGQPRQKTGSGEGRRTGGAEDVDIGIRHRNASIAQGDDVPKRPAV